MRASLAENLRTADFRLVPVAKKYECPLEDESGCQKSFTYEMMATIHVCEVEDSGVDDDETLSETDLEFEGLQVTESSGHKQQCEFRNATI